VVEIHILSHLCLCRETPDETFVELVDVRVLETLTVADGEYYTVWMSEQTSQCVRTMLH